MRLSSAYVQTIKTTINLILDNQARIWLFGSRVDDNLRGGDIDLFVETDAELPNRVKILCQLYGALIIALGDQKLDIILKDFNTAELPLFEMIRQKGILL